MKERGDADVLQDNGDNASLTEGLAEADLKSYKADDGVGLAHIRYWTLKPDDPAYETLDPGERAKVGKIQMNVAHSVRFQPTQVVPGREATGLLAVDGRRQRVVLKAPDAWNGRLVVLGTPGLRNEYANEAIFVPWLLVDGYACVMGDKGLLEGPDAMFSGRHLSAGWGPMMRDLAVWASERLADVAGREAGRIYAAGLSNGGYQVRRALELDAESVAAGRPRLFDGGLDWSGVHWPHARALGIDPGVGGAADAGLVAAWTGAVHLMTAMDRAALTMGWACGPDTLTTPEQFAADPSFPAAQDAMLAAGFTPESAPMWGYYNIFFDAFKTILPGLRCVGFYNSIAHAYRAELRGDDAEAASAYSCNADPENPETSPPLYDWLARHPDGGWDADTVRWALKNATTGRFSAPMISLAGEADALLGYPIHAVAYRRAVEAAGRPDLYRLYTIKNAGHVDAHADGNADYNFDGVAGDEGIAERFVPMQAHVQRAFRYLVDWVEKGEAPPESRIVPTDPMNVVTDPAALDFASDPAARS